MNSSNLGKCTKLLEIFLLAYEGRNFFQNIRNGLMCPNINSFTTFWHIVTDLDSCSCCWGWFTCWMILTNTGLWLVSCGSSDETLCSDWLNTCLHDAADDSHLDNYYETHSDTETDQTDGHYEHLNHFQGRRSSSDRAADVSVLWICQHSPQLSVYSIDTESKMYNRLTSICLYLDTVYTSQLQYLLRGAGVVM